MAAGKGVWGVEERGAEDKLGKVWVGFNNTLPREAQRTRGTRVCDREGKGVFRQKELRSMGETMGDTGLELEGDWGGEGQYQ